MDAWKGILQTPEIISYFEDVFESLGVSIEETGETFTLQQITDLNKKGKPLNFTLTYGNIHQFHQEIRMIMQ